jgi:nucleotide-binding universal stress UspA family protein
MKSMLILTDFSEAAFRAAEYACQLADCLQIKRIILFHAFQPAFVGTPDAAVIVGDDQQTYIESVEALGLLQDRLKPLVEHNVIFELAAEETVMAGLGDVINEQNKKENIEMIVMGVSSKSGLENYLLGSTTKEILRKNEWPVLIVPENTPIGKGIKTIVFTSDLKELNTIPSRQLYEFLDAVPADVQVVNVEQKTTEKYSPALEKAITDLHELLKKYKPSFNYITGENIVEEILKFAGEKHASLIIAVHQQHGFLSSLFHKSITRKLAYKSDIPLLALPGMK